MNRGNHGNSRNGKSQVSWRPKHSDSSPNHQTLIRDDVSPAGSFSSASVEKSYSSGRAAEKNSGGGMYRNVNPPIRQGGGWSTFSSGSSSGEGNVGNSTPSSNAVENNLGVEKSNSSGNAVVKNSGGGMSRNVTPATRQGRGWSTFGSGGSSSGGNGGQSASSFNTVEKNFGVEKSNSSGHAVDKNSGGSMYRNVTPRTRQGGGWAAFSSGTSISGDNVGQSASPSNASSNASGFRSDERIGFGSDQLNLSGNAKALSKGDSDRSAVNLDRTFMESLPEAAQLSGESVDLKSCSEVNTLESTDSLRETKNTEFPIQKFDLCPPKPGVFKLKTSLIAQNRVKRKENERMSCGLQGDILRPGMVLLKNYLSISEQASILKICRDHGLVHVGFYQPQFGDGGKMHLKLMCFGQFWNPETNLYEEVRPADHSKPPSIPHKLLELVDRAVKDSQSLIRERERVKNVESILPSVKPDICLVNYYTETGRLGLHQDKDESQESLRKGIPIVSFSIGDSAEFLYSDQRDVEKADKVKLESGDVLIFGGKARHIFHGVPAIERDTAPKMLLDETNFRSGRLNLTFRQRC